jgi:hypothetical protein
LALSVPGRADLIGYYSFDNSTFSDTSGHSNNGVAARNSPGFATGIGGDTGVAAQFNGAPNQQYFTLPINLNNYSGYTFGAWVYVPSVPTIPPYEGLIAADPTIFQAGIDIDNRAGALGYSAFDGFSGTNDGVIGGIPVTASQWTFVAVSYDNVAHTVTLDVNGTIVTGTTAFTGGTTTTIAVGSDTCCNQGFTGYMDNVFVYNTAMTTSQLNALQADSDVLANTPEPGSAGLLLFGAGLLVAGNYVSRRRVTLLPNVRGNRP